MELIISNGGDINARDNYNATVTHSASMNCKLEVLKYIISKGGDINAKDIGNKTPVDYAEWNQNKNVREYLLYIIEEDTNAQTDIK